MCLPSAIRGMFAPLVVLCVAWPLACEAATRATATKEGLLLRRSRTQRRQEPFIVSFRVTIKNGADNILLANNLSAKINEPGSPEAYKMPFAVSRVFNGTFPPVQWPAATTTGPAMTYMEARHDFSEDDSRKQRSPVVGRPAQPSAMKKALRALRVAKENRAAFDSMAKHLRYATEQHANALTFNNPLGTTPGPNTLYRDNADDHVAPEEPKTPRTLGRLVYDAFVNTPKPQPITTPMPTPAVPTVPLITAMP